MTTAKIALSEVPLMAPFPYVARADPPALLGGAMQFAASHAFLHLGVMVILVLAVIAVLVISRMRSRARNPKGGSDG